ATTNFKTLTPNRPAPAGFTVSVYDNLTGETNLNPIANHLAQTPDGMHDFNHPIFDFNTFPDFQNAYPTLTDGDQFTILWEGGMDLTRAPTGTYTFGTASDDGSVVYIDLTGDGDYDDPGELVVDNNGNHGRRERTGTADLTELRCYNLAIAMYENTGGQNMEFKVRFGPGHAYSNLFFVSGWPTNTRPFGITCPLPVFGIQNTGVSNLAPDRADLMAEMDASGSVFCVEAFWGTTNGGTNLALWTHQVHLGCFTNVMDVPFTHTPAGLLTNTVHWYTYRITNCSTSVWAFPSISFKTLGQPVVDNAPGPDSQPFGEAWLQGTLLDGSEADITVYFGDNDGDTNPANWDVAIDLGRWSEGSGAVLRSNLLYGVQYYYRVFASNAVGTAWANSTTHFKTLPPNLPAPPGLQVSVYDTLFGPANLDPISNLFAQTPDGTHDFNNSIFDFNNYADFQTAYPSLTSNTQFTILWRGAMDLTRAPTGTYTFGTASDDGSVMYIDLNNDGDFADPGELVVDNNGNHGRTELMGTATLDQRRCYPIALAMYEQGGGENMEFKYRLGTGHAYVDLFFFEGWPTNTQPFGTTCPIDVFGIQNTGAANIDTNQADITALMSASISVFEVTAYWGPNDGDTNSILWSNQTSLGWFTNVSDVALSVPATGLVANTTNWYTYRISNCATVVWATPSFDFLAAPTTNCAVDTDGDGMTDCDEICAGTDPMDPNSFLWVQIALTGTQTVYQLTFPTEPGQTYAVETSLNLFSNGWNTIFSNLPGLGTARMLLHTNPTGRAYYRIRVE
ncbi:MAG: PA14 domain-containing protein, partial [Verrucomicrobiota bacterium]